jgi:hypothetical protein
MPGSRVDVLDSISTRVAHVNYLQSYRTLGKPHGKRDSGGSHERVVRMRFACLQRSLQEARNIDNDLAVCLVRRTKRASLPSNLESMLTG